MMKKTFCLLLALALCLFLSACGKSEKVQAVEEQIASIGTVNENSLEKIEEIASLYGALSEKEQRQVENYDELTRAQDEYDKLMADKVSQAIHALGEIDENSGDQLENAFLAYDALTGSQKELVENYSDLQAAKEQYETALVARVEAIIEKLQYSGGEPSQQLQDAIHEAEAAYEGLEDSLKGRVKNSGAIAQTAEAVSQYYIQEAQTAIDAAIENDSNYQEAEALYNALTSEQKDKIVNYVTFTENFTAYKNKPPIELVSCRLKKDIIGEPELYVKAQNISDKIVKEFSATVFAFDEDGIPVSVYMGDYSKGLRYSSAIKPDEYTSSNSYWQLYGEYSDMQQIVVILNDVEFFDGSTWENSQYDTLCGKYEQQLLSEGDKNILPKG